MITVTDHGPVRELRLDRPPANALSPELLVRLCDLVDAAPAEGARALVLSGSPGMFSGGLDVPVLLGLDRAAMGDAWELFHRGMRALAASTLPVVAAITGHSPGGGMVLALFCDRRVMAEGPFKIGLNEVSVGIPLPRVILTVLRRQVGARRAERLAVTGALLDPTGALEAGLVDEVVPADQLLERSVGWCRQLLELPQDAVAATRSAARADLVAVFDHIDRPSLEAELDRCWFADEPQRILTRLVQRLTKRA
jgi:enoyl-CoA hydratase/carnithine racemase